MVQFFQTHMGQKFYERDIPEMVRKLNEIADLDVGSNTALLHKSKKVDMTPTPDAATPQQAPPPLWGTQVA